jgi:hypothetical protein
VEIDAFSNTHNDFIPDYFVDVGADGPADRTHYGLGPRAFQMNEDGYLSTETLKEPITIKARGEIADTFLRYRFVEWHVIPGFTSGSPMPVVDTAPSPFTRRPG